jgi:hypothetical protein
MLGMGIFAWADETETMITYLTKDDALTDRKQLV